MHKNTTNYNYELCYSYKKGQNTNISNYRPTTILSNLLKVFENVLYIKLYRIIKPRMSSYRYGFISTNESHEEFRSHTMYNLQQNFTEPYLESRSLTVIINNFTKRHITQAGMS